MLGCIRPLLFVFLAPVVLGIAVLLYYGSGEEEAKKALARARPAPAMVDIGKYVPGSDAGPVREAIVLAQADMRMRHDYSRMKDGNESDRYVLVPLYALDAKSPAEPAVGVLVRRGRLSLAEVDRLTTGQGPIGPILKIDGELLTDADVRRAMEGGGLGGQVAIRGASIAIDPYPDGRDAALAPSRSGRDAAWTLGWIAVLMFFGGIAVEIMVRRHRGPLY